MRQEQLARGLGWFSIGLGLAQIAMPRRFSRMVGIRNGAGWMRSVGARELASGIGILAQHRPKAGLSARIAGDVMDMSLLAYAMRANSARRNRLAATTAVLGGIAALDVYARRAVSIPPIIRLSLAINRPAEELYNFWRNPLNLSRLFKHIESVEAISDRRWRWVAKGPQETRVEWDADIIEDRPNELISWKSVEGASFENEGNVRFEHLPTGHGTAVSIEMRYRVPGGEIGRTVANLTAESPRQQVWDALHAFKQIMETGEVATTMGQPAGHRPPSFMQNIEAARQARL